MLKIGTDFSGIGSPEQALIKLGVEHQSMFACDYDKYAKQSYLANYEPLHFYDDITKRNHKETPYVDLYVAGFPCQAFSMAGKRKGFDDTRGTLFFDLLQYLKEQRPKYFILENVKGLISHNKGHTFKVILDALAKSVNGETRGGLFGGERDDVMLQCLGYHIYHKVLNTKNFGIPQNRERIFIVGFREDNHNFKFPQEIPLELNLKDILQDNPQSKYFLSERMVKGIEKSNYRERKPISVNGICRTLKIGGDTPCFDVDEKYYLSEKHVERLKRHNNKTLGKDISATIHAGYFKGGGRDQQYIDTEVKSGAIRPYPRDYNKRGLKRTVRIEERKDEVSNCLTTDYNDFLISTSKSGIIPLDNKIIKQKRIRRLTPLECLRLQGFPDSFFHKCKEEGLSDTQIYKQAGNSMTVDVMAFLINEILKNENKND